MAAEGLAALWPGKAPSGTDLAGIIIGNDALNACRYHSRFDMHFLRHPLYALRLHCT